MSTYVQIYSTRSVLNKNNNKANNNNDSDQKAYLSCSAVPPDVALEMAHAASFLMSNSADWRSSTRGCIIPAFITACFINAYLDLYIHFDQITGLEQITDTTH